MVSDDELLLLYAAEGPVESLKQVMDNCSSFMLHNALDTAAEYGNVECVKALAPVCSANGSHAFWGACYEGRADVIEALLQHGFCADGAIGDCMEYQKFDCFKVLASYSDLDDFCDALQRSFLIENKEQAERGRQMLMEYCDTDMVLCVLSANSEYAKAYEWMHTLVAYEQQQRIAEQLMPSCVQRARSKI